MAASGSSSGIRAGRAYVELNVSDKLTEGDVITTYRQEERPSR